MRNLWHIHTQTDCIIADFVARIGLWHFNTYFKIKNACPTKTINKKLGLPLSDKPIENNRQNFARAYNRCRKERTKMPRSDSAARFDDCKNNAERAETMYRTIERAKNFCPVPSIKQTVLKIFLFIDTVKFLPYTCRRSIYNNGKNM